MIWAQIDGKLLSPDEVEERLARNNVSVLSTGYGFTYTALLPSMMPAVIQTCAGKDCKSTELLDKGLCGPCLAIAEEIPEHMREGWIACYKELVEEEKKEQQDIPVAPRPAFRIPTGGGII